MNPTLSKWQQIANWYAQKNADGITNFNPPAAMAEIAKIEALLGEKLPADLEQMLLMHNGEDGSGRGRMCGVGMVSAETILRNAEFALSQIKPEERYLKSPEKSKELLDKIVDFYRQQIPQPWYKIEFDCSENSFGGPYLYETAGTTGKDRKIVRMKYDDIRPIIKQLADLENPTWNWDKLEFEIYADSYTVKRTDYNFDEEIPFTSFPENAIKKKYFNHKWIPVFEDGGGNYIGVDLDPDIKGTKGQVIIFGRDEENMVVLGKNLEEFFDFCIAQIEKYKGNDLENPLLNESHLHDVLRGLITEN